MQIYVKELTIPVMLKVFKANKLLIFTIIMAVIMLGTLVIVKKKSEVQKTYELSGILQINNSRSADYTSEQIIDRKTHEAISMVNLAPLSEVEAALILTRYILSPIIERQNLDIDVSVKPLSFTQKLFKKKWPQSISVKSFNVSDQYINKSFQIKILNKKHYQILLPNSNTIIAEGDVNNLVRNADYGLTIEVNTIDAHSGDIFLIQKKGIDNIVNNLAQSIHIEQLSAEKTLNPAVTGVIKISMTGTDPNKQAEIINGIMHQLEIRAYDERMAILNSSLNFVIKESLKAYEALKKSQDDLVKFQKQNGVINIGSQGSEYIADLSSIQQKILENNISIFQAKNVYTEHHPLMQALISERQQLLANKKEIDTRLNKLPSDEEYYLNLKSQLDINHSNYLFLLNKIQELKIQQSRITNPIKILQYADHNINENTDAYNLKNQVIILFFAVLIVFILVISVIFIYMIDPLMGAKFLNYPLFAKIYYKEESGKATDLELFVGMLLQVASLDNQESIIFNFGSIKERSGKTFIINYCKDYFRNIGYTAIKLEFGIGENFLKVPDAITKINDESSKLEILRIDAISMLNEEYFHRLFHSLNKFKIILLETPAIKNSMLFLVLATKIRINFLLLTDKDNSHVLNEYQNYFSNLKDIKIIFNYPSKHLIKSIY